MHLYESLLAPHGKIVMNITNRNMDLTDIVSSSANAVGFTVRHKRDRLRSGLQRDVSCCCSYRGAGARRKGLRRARPRKWMAPGDRRSILSHLDRRLLERPRRNPEAPLSLTLPKRGGLYARAAPRGERACPALTPSGRRLQSAVLETFRPSVGLWRALRSAARWRSPRSITLGRRQGARPARQRAGFCPLDLPPAYSPPSLVADRHAPVGAERNRVRLRLRHAGLRPVLLARRHRRRADARIWRRTRRLLWPAWIVLTLATVLQLLAYELAYWSAHYGFHKVPALWEFHKVHHSAEVMTTLTELRQHPVEIIVVHELDRACDRNRVRRHDLCLRPRRAPVHAC